MIKLHSLLLSGLVISSHLMGSSGDHGVYYQELKDLKKRPETKMLFDEYANPILAQIQRDVDVYKHASKFQGSVANFVFGIDSVIVTQESMPRLYSYVATLCQEYNVEMPVIFVTRHKNFIGAIATKILKISGCILLGQKLLRDFSDETIEAVVAHELGHLKYNHINKKLLACMLSSVVFWKACDMGASKMQINVHPFIKISVATILGSLFSRALDNKRHEKEADEFAYKVADKGAGLIKYFEFLQQKKADLEKDFVVISDMLMQDKIQLKELNIYYDALINYYIAKCCHAYDKAYSYLYYNTFLGAHPSNQARIDAAKEYLVKQQA